MVVIGPPIYISNNTALLNVRMRKNIITPIINTYVRNRSEPLKVQWKGKSEKRT